MAVVKLTPGEIAERLKHLAGWELKDNAISKLFRFKEFMQGVRFVDRIAEIAQAADHHPDIAINYTRVRFSCSTHSEGGLTEKDFKLAGEIEGAFKAAGGGQ